MKMLLRSITAVLSTMAMAVAFLVTGQTVVANAAPASDPMREQRNVQMTRSFSDNELSPGEQFTVTYTFYNDGREERTGDN